jgi:two-component system, LuxR family, sensor kinase FixL
LLGRAQNTQRTVVVGMPIARLLSRRHVEIALAYLAGYVLLDWLSFVHPFGSFGITPWNPPTGLSFALILLLGPEFIPWLLVAPLLADGVVRGFALPWGAEVAATLIIGGGYALAASLLLLPRLRFDPALGSRHSLILLVGMAVASTAVVAASYVGMLVAFGVLPAADLGRAAIRFWVGDAIGITVLTPFLLVLMTRRRLVPPSWEAVAMLILALAALWLVFSFTEAWRFQLFYLFFLPVIWTAVRFGLEGVTAGLVVTQVGLIAAIHFTEQGGSDVTAYQALMVVLSLTGLAVGVLVSEQQRTQAQLRLNEEALSRSLRVGTMGEFAAALAHEINQPLTAVANYARLVKSAGTPAAASEASDRLLAQVQRAAEVVRRLRNFIRLGRSEMAPIAVPRLVQEAVAYCHAELDRHGVALSLRLDRDLPVVKADALQIEQVLVNLVRNAAEALADAGRRDGRVAIEAEWDGTDSVIVRVRDNGPGFDPGLAERAATPFATTKADGLGLGLSLARSIVEAHGGRLAIESTASGAAISFTLPALVGRKGAP